MVRIFHVASYLSVLFAVLAIYYIFHGSLYRPANSLEEVGLGVFFMGFSLAFGSMKDITKFSEKEKKLLSDPRRYKNYLRFILSICAVMLLTSLSFISMKWIGRDSKLAKEYFNLGLNCIPIIVATFAELKQFIDKKRYFDLVSRDSID